MMFRLINFLTEAGKYKSSYQFPNARDKIWVQRENILMIFKSLRPVGKSNVVFNLTRKSKKKLKTHTINAILINVILTN